MTRVGHAATGTRPFLVCRRPRDAGIYLLILLRPCSLLSTSLSVEIISLSSKGQVLESWQDVSESGNGLFLNHLFLAFGITSGPAVGPLFSRFMKEIHQIHAKSPKLPSHGFRRPLRFQSTESRRTRKFSMCVSVGCCT